MPSAAIRLAVAVALVSAVASPLRAAEPAAGAFDPSVARRIKPEELQQRRKQGEKLIVLDTRGVPTDVTARGAVHVPNDRIEVWAKDVPKDAFIVAYCTWHAEATSARAVLQLQQLGFTNSYALLGGLDAWRAAKLETDPVK